MIYIQKQYEYLAQGLPDVREYDIEQFANQEIYIRLLDDVQGKNCKVIGSLTASADQALQLLLLLHTLYKAGAKQVSLIAPYLGYERQDNNIFQASQGLLFADAMLHAVRVQKVITIDPHNQLSLKDLQVPVIFYTSQYFFEHEMARFVLQGFSFVFPDAGAQQRYAWITEKFPTALQAWFVKKRTHGMVQLESFEGKIYNKVIICDDILDSGKTLLQICIALRQMGVQQIVIFVTHGFFHAHAWHDLFSLGVQFLYCTKSLPAAENLNHPQIIIKNLDMFLKKII